MKWYNVEVNNGTEDKNLKSFLSKNGIKFDSSGAGNLVHFEILASEAEVKNVNNFLEG